ncbi:MAG: serine hydrolase, partial [Acidobacteriota bacterium]
MKLVVRRQLFFALNLTLTLALLASGCGRGTPQPEPPADIGPDLQGLVDAAVADNEQVHAVALHVDTPLLGLSWQGAAGEADPETGTPMTAETPFQIASNTKTFIAASILRLWEDGRIGLDDPVAEHLLPETVEILTSDGYDLQAMTVRHLLTHTGGFFDYAHAEQYMERITADPAHRWTRKEQIESTVAWGDPLAPPGEVFNYSDTDYILLGEMLEQITGLSMPDAVRELVGYQKLGLDSTWFETLEPRPAEVPAPAHPFYGETDATAFDVSTDLYGGGGLFSTVGDMARFFRALFTGGVYLTPETTATMLTTVEVPPPAEGDQTSWLAPGAYKMGVWVTEVDGFTAYRHTGFWGSSATYVPDLDLVV